jgi:Putative Na+/H+ antiporter
MNSTAVSLPADASYGFQLASLIIFGLAIIHTFFANVFISLSEKVAAKHAERIKDVPGANSVSFKAEILYFFGEVEIIFGIWVVPLIITGICFYNWKTMLHYFETRDYTEPLFVVVIMSVAATRPILKLAEDGLRFVAKLMGGSVSAWWISILIIGPILGSFITEAGAMTICALLLARRFYAYAPNRKLAYGTLGLLFVNISVGGVLTNFAAPPVLIIQRVWEWSTAFMITNFGWKAVVGVFVTTICYFIFFRKDLKQLGKVKHLADFEDEEKQEKMPIWVTLVHVFFLVAIVTNTHHPIVFLGAYLLFLGFHQATSPHQIPIQLKRPLFVALFLIGLVIHGGLQGWWITPLLGNLNFEGMMVLSMVLTAFNDNAAIAYLASLIPDLSEILKYAVLSGVIIGGGLTVIANAPNPAGLVILKRYFHGKISPIYLLFGAFFPTAVFFVIFYFLR